MRIAYIDEAAFTRRHGGASTWTAQLSESMREKGHEVTVFSFAHGMRSRLPDMVKLYPYLRELLVFPVLGAALMRRIERDYDILHFASTTTPALYRPRTVSFMTTNFVCSRQIRDFAANLPRNYRILFNRFSSALFKRIESRGTSNVTHLFPPRRDVKRFLMRQLDQPEDKITLCPYPVNPDLFMPGERTNTGSVLFVGRATLGKGFDVLLEAADDINGEVQVVVSRIPEKFARQVGHKKNIRVIVGAPRSDVIELFKSAALFVMPSISETGPIVTLEAMASGLPVVCTPQGAGDYIVGEENGYIVPYKDPQALADRINALLGNPALAAEIGARNRSIALERYHCRETYSMIESAYIKQLEAGT